MRKPRPLPVWDFYAFNGDYLGSYTYTPAQLRKHFAKARIVPGGSVGHAGAVYLP